MAENEPIPQMDTTDETATSEAPPELPREDQRRNAEALILASPEPITAARVARLIPGCNAAAVRSFVGELNGEYLEQGRAFEICDVGGGFQVRTLPEFSTTLQKIQNTRPLRLSQASLETLAIISYRQPITRAEVENVRGVDAGAVTRSLLERNLIRIAGHREVPGRPMLFATTRRFLEVFGLSSLDGLPTLRNLEERAPKFDADGTRDAEFASEGEGPGGVDGDEAGADLGADAEGEAAPVDDALAVFADVKPVGEPH